MSVKLISYQFFIPNSFLNIENFQSNIARMNFVNFAKFLKWKNRNQKKNVSEYYTLYQLEIENGLKVCIFFLYY